MNEVTALFLRRMQGPLLLIIVVYSIAITGLILIPGIDAEGHVSHMSIFHAFYFVSYTATTIGFGELPNTFTESQRLWTIIIIYMTVISWFYALGTVITLFQDKTFIKERKKLKFKRDVNNIHRPYYVVCGFGETGKAVTNALLKEHFGAVVIERLEDITDRNLDDTLEYVPNLTADAAETEVLELAGVHLDRCRGVIAVTASDETNLKIAIISKLLHPDVTVICRSDNKEHEENMLSFGTEHIINPFENFANIFSMALHSPSMHLIYDWLTGAPNTSLSTPLHIEQGHWILSGYGRFGEKLHKVLCKNNIRTIVIDPRKSTKEAFMRNKLPDDQFIIGTGTDAKTLNTAGIDKAAGVIAGSDNDPNNLSLIMTARQLNKHVFVVGRQNFETNELLYTKINEHYHTAARDDSDELNTIAHLAMRPSEIIARRIRALLIAPLLIDFIDNALLEDQQWANITISRLIAVIGEDSPIIWTVRINKEDAPAVAQALGFGRSIQLKHITRDQKCLSKTLAGMTLLLKRGDQIQLLPDDNTELKALDELLFCGLRNVKDCMSATLNDISLLNYVMTSKNEPQSYIWRKMTRLRQKQERRLSRR
jgi:Trk K+ transport system NAD-binding subunit